jgi:hypothetical protein
MGIKEKKVLADKRWFWFLKDGTCLNPEMLLLMKPLSFQDLLFFFHQWRRDIARRLKF